MPGYTEHTLTGIVCVCIRETWCAYRLRCATGKEYEARLRQQHSKLNPRTSWASQPGRGAKRRRTGYGEDSEDDE